MYKLDGKPIVPDYGRKNPGINRQEFEALKTDVIKLRDELEALKAEKPVSVSIGETEQIPADFYLEALKGEAISLGIDIKGNWGEKRIAQAIEDAKKEGKE